jgi:hypothetical protein
MGEDEIRIRKSEIFFLKINLLSNLVIRLTYTINLYSPLRKTRINPNYYFSRD